MMPTLQNSYAGLPAQFYNRQQPAVMPAPKLVRLNAPLARQLGLDPGWLRTQDGVAFLAGSQLPDHAEPLAMAYAGHQFGVFVPQLGDGRAILLGEVADRNGRLWDIHIKGAGRTPYSRSGDGRAGLGPVLREYIISEAMAALGVPTTRSLAALTTGEEIRRERALPGAILVRVAGSHVRVGTFQYFAARGDTDSLRLLADHVIARHFPDFAHAEQPYRALLDDVVSRQAELIAGWMQIGFIHGVMNTDNMSVAGETIDYGPCAFMDSYDPGTVYSSIDQRGRYAYGNQPAIGQWNLCRLAEAMVPLLASDQKSAVAIAQAAVDGFADKYETAWLSGMRRKLGLTTAREGDRALVTELFACMAANGADFTLTFRRLGDLICPDVAMSPGRHVRDLFGDPDAFDQWLLRWRERLDQDGAGTGEPVAVMQSSNPAYIPRNHRVEAVLRAAVDDGDFAPLDNLMSVLSTPYAVRAEFACYSDPPAPGEEVRATFCGT